MVIKSICPKCGKTGTQVITHHPNKLNSKFEYLEMLHSEDKKRCYIGKIRSTEEAIQEFDNTDDETQQLKIIKTEINEFLNGYAPKTRLYRSVVLKMINNIFDKYDSS